MVEADDGIVILEPDARSRNQPASSASAATTGSRSPRPAQARRGTRGRSPSTPSPTKSVEAARPRALTSFVAQSMAQKKNRPLEIAPLSSPLAPINSPLHDATSAATTLDPAKTPTALPAVNAGELLELLAKPTRMRATFLLSEILQPPIALRRRRGGR